MGLRSRARAAVRRVVERLASDRAQAAELQELEFHVDALQDQVAELARAVQRLADRFPARSGVSAPGSAEPNGSPDGEAPE